MTDTLSPEARSRHMARIRGKDSRPEWLVRRRVHAMGYRYRLHRKDLPGTPDLVFPARRAVVFVHGCFWHAHEGCANARVPKSRESFWRAKFAANHARDARDHLALITAGWRVMVVWECETKDMESVASRLLRFLEAEAPYVEVR